MGKGPFKKPADYAEPERSHPVSTRITEEAAKVLERAADEQGKKLAWLMTRVLEDYARWLQEQAGPGRSRT